MEPDNQNMGQAKSPTAEAPKMPLAEAPNAQEPGVTKAPGVSVLGIMFRRFANWCFERHGVKTLIGSPEDHIQKTNHIASIVFSYMMLCTAIPQKIEEKCWLDDLN